MTRFFERCFALQSRTKKGLRLKTDDRRPRTLWRRSTRFWKAVYLIASAFSQRIAQIDPWHRRPSTLLSITFNRRDRLSFICPFVHSLVRLCVNPSVRLHLSVRESVRPSVSPSVRPSVRSSAFPFARRPSVRPSSSPSFLSTERPPIRPSNCPSVCPSVRTSRSVHPSVVLSDRPSVVSPFFYPPSVRLDPFVHLFA